MGQPPCKCFSGRAAADEPKARRQDGAAADEFKARRQGPGAGSHKHGIGTRESAEELQQAIDKLTAMGFSSRDVTAAVHRSRNLEGALSLLMEGAATSGPDTRARGAWQWRADDKWNDYDVEAAQKLTDAYLKGRPNVSLTHGVYSKQGGYRIDLTKMTQSRMDGGRARSIRGRVNGKDVKPVVPGGPPLSPDPTPVPTPEKCDGAEDFFGRADEEFVDTADGSTVAVASALGYEWRDHKGWHAYQADISSAIGAAAKMGKSTVQVHIAGRPYEMDLTTMQQKNVTTGATRDIRPVLEPHAPVDTCDSAKRPTEVKVAIWEWCEDAEIVGDFEFSELWVLYEESASAEIERAFKEGQRSAEITGANGLRYTVLFDEMMQVSTARNTKRPVRRTESSFKGLEVPSQSSAPLKGIISSSDAGKANWQQHTGNGVWATMDREMSDQLEKAFKALSEGVEARTATQTLNADFEHLMAEDAAAGKKMEIRRIPVQNAIGFEEDAATGKESMEILQTVRSERTPFVDSEFCGTAALFKDREKPVPVESWKRPADVHGLGRDCVLIHDDVLPKDVAQGGIGDCWLVSVLAVLAMQPRLLHQLLPTPDGGAPQRDKTGAYIVRLCDAGQWRHMLIDDLLPCRKDGGLVYISNNRKQLWAPLIEKGYAKLLGSYEALVGGQMYEAMSMLTGYVCDEVKINERPPHAAWLYLTSMLDRGFLLCTSLKGSINPEKAKEKGLVTRHAYSLLTYHAGDVRLVELRNPHGRGVWKGDWSDLSEKWKEPGAPQVRHDGVFQKPPTGRFWMSFEDLMEWFGIVQYCKVRPESWNATHMGVSIAPPDLLGDRLRALHFKVESVTSAELSMLQVGRRGRGRLPGHADIGFALLRAAPGPRTAKTIAVDGKRFELVTDCARAAKGCVSLELDFHPGEYAVVPLVVAGRRAARPGSGQDRATLVLHSHPGVLQGRTADGLPATLLRDITVLRALTSGERYHTFSDWGEIILLREPIGQTVVAFNRSPRYGLRVSIYADGSLRADASRGNLRTVDVVPPGHAQVLQVLSFSIHSSGPKTLKWSLRVRADEAKEFHQPSVRQPLHEVVPWTQ